MLDDADMRFAIDDARTRHKALADLIYFVDGQAIKFLGLYVTLGLAASTAAIAGFTSNAPIPNAASIGLSVAVIFLGVGSWFCFVAMQPASVGLPGRDAAFWLWANNPSVDRQKFFTEYLENLTIKMTANRKINDETADALSRAKLCGVLAPATALAVGIIALLFRV